MLTELQTTPLPKLTLKEQAIIQLNRSGLLVQYVRELIIAETLTAWERSAPDSILQRRGCANEIDIPTIEIGEEQKLRLERYKQAHWGHQIKSRFLACQSQLDRVLFSTIEVVDLSLAQELYCRITEQGYSFHKLAITHSQNSTAKLGGVVGPIAPAYLHPLIQQQLKGLEAKQLSPIFRVENHYIFLRLDRKLPVQLNAQVEQQLIDELFESWLEQQIIDRISTIRVANFVPAIECIPYEVDILEIPILTEESISQREGYCWGKRSATANELEPTVLLSSEQISITSSFFLPIQSGDAIAPKSFFAPSNSNISNAPTADRCSDSIGQKIITFFTDIFTRKPNRLVHH